MQPQPHRRSEPACRVPAGCTATHRRECRTSIFEIVLLEADHGLQQQVLHAVKRLSPYQFEARLRPARIAGQHIGPGCQPAQARTPEQPPLGQRLQPAQVSADVPNTIHGGNLGQNRHHGAEVFRAQGMPQRLGMHAIAAIPVCRVTMDLAYIDACQARDSREVRAQHRWRFVPGPASVGSGWEGKQAARDHLVNACLYRLTGHDRRSEVRTEVSERCQFRKAAQPVPAQTRKHLFRQVFGQRATACLSAWK
ncbi:hypothetical protein D9M68_597250 [compost metagenome]